MCVYDDKVGVGMCISCRMLYTVLLCILLLISFLSTPRKYGRGGYVIKRVYGGGAY